MITAERISGLQDMVLKGDASGRESMTEEEKEAAAGLDERLNAFSEGLAALIEQYNRTADRKQKK